MKPFDLSAALAGAPVQTRDGRSVTQLVKFDVAGDYCLVGVVNKTIYTWTSLGGYSGESNCYNDLFMASTKKTGWVARYASNTVGGVIWGSEKVAVTECPHAVSYHKIEWEED